MSSEHILRDGRFSLETHADPSSCRISFRIMKCLDTCSYRNLDIERATILFMISFMRKHVGWCGCEDIPCPW